MRWITIFVIVIVVLSCKSNPGERKFKRVDMFNRMVEGHFTNDSIVDGEFKYYTYTNYLDSKITFSHGQKNGVAVNYYPNGSIWDSSFYKSGVKHGHHYVFDSLNRLVYRDYYFYGQTLGGQIFYKRNRINRYVFHDFEKNQLYEGLYDSTGALYKYGGEIVNANLYQVNKNSLSNYGVFAYLLDPPNVTIKYTLGLIEDITDDKKELATFVNERVFIDTIVPEPGMGWNYYIAADYNDTINNYHKVFLTVLKWGEKP
jgi:antitoxin component YwqK of YwqJK toxin-antitoxin module